MKEIQGSIWIHYCVPGHFICLTTNGVVKKNGEAVMGRGNAKQATLVLPGIALMLGNYLKSNGNHAGFLPLPENDSGLIIFPVKQVWWEKADLDLIRESARWLEIEAHLNPGNVYHLPRPGCGNGQRDYQSEVKPLLINLPDNVWVHHILLEELSTIPLHSRA